MKDMWFMLGPIIATIMFFFILFYINSDDSPDEISLEDSKVNGYFIDNPSNTR